MQTQQDQKRQGPGRNRRNRRLGQSMVEYVALTALVAIVSIGTVKILGSKVRSRLNQITNTFDRNIQQGLKAPGRMPNTGAEGSGAPGGFRFPTGLKLPGGLPIPDSFPVFGD